jgi:hypothetical protein
MFIRSVFLKPFDTYERMSGLSTNIETIVKKIAENETRSSLYDLGEMVLEKQMYNYNIAGTAVQFRVNELYGAKVLHAKTTNDDAWLFITKFDCN